MAKKKSGKIRFFFGRNMSEAEIVDAVIRIAKEYGIPFKDDRRKHGIPIVDSRKRDMIKYGGKTAIADDRKEKGKGPQKRGKEVKKQR